MTTPKDTPKDATPQDVAQDTPQDATSGPQRPAWPAGTKVNAKGMAALLSDPKDAAHGYGLGRSVDPKRVRSVARDRIERYDDEGYTPHAYDQSDADVIVAAMRESRTAGGTATADAIRAAATASKGGSK